MPQEFAAQVKESPASNLYRAPEVHAGEPRSRSPRGRARSRGAGTPCADQLARRASSCASSPGAAGRVASATPQPRTTGGPRGGGNQRHSRAQPAPPATLDSIPHQHEEPSAAQCDPPAQLAPLAQDRPRAVTGAEEQTSPLSSMPGHTQSRSGSVERAHMIRGWNERRSCAICWWPWRLGGRGTIGSAPPTRRS